MELFLKINAIIGVIFMLSYLYQFVYIPIAVLKKPDPHRETKRNRYAVLIAGRNEAAVIGQLINSLKAQTYPSELLQIFVIADNCTDNTAEVARNAGAEVYERQNKTEIGKGYALDFLIQKINSKYGEDYFDGFMVFDADNIAEPNFVEEINKTFSDGYRVVTSYRNSKNFGDNWVSAGNSMWFLRDSQFLNRARMRIHTSCIVAGTGFLVHRDILKESGGWKYHLITEDTQFTVCQMLKGEKIGYCETAVFYDEQPVKFRESWNQRMRWARGGWYVFRDYGWKLTKKIFTAHSFSCFDMFMSFFPAMILSALAMCSNIVATVLSCIAGRDPLITLASFAGLIGGAYGTFLIISAITTITEWKRIYCPVWKKILYMFTFPLFMITYIPMPLIAMFKKVEWTPIAHTRVKNHAEIINADK